jgi:hypothetical protein
MTFRGGRTHLVMRQHPRVWARGTKPAMDTAEPTADLPDGALVAVVYAPDEPIAAWVEEELEADGARIQIARSMSGLVQALVADPTPRPHVLIVDLDALAPAELMELHAIRHKGWFGSIVALGHTPSALRRSLSIDVVLAQPVRQNQLRDAFAQLREPVKTIRIPVVQITG